MPAYNGSGHNKNSDSINVNEDYLPLEPKLTGNEANKTSQQQKYNHKNNNENKKSQKDSSRSPTNEDSDTRSPAMSNQFSRGKKGAMSDFEGVEEVGEEEIQGVPNVLLEFKLIFNIEIGKYT